MGAGRWSVVVVDDLEDVRFLHKLILRRGPFDVVAEGENGHDAVRLARDHQPHLMLLDLAMPHMDGLEALPHVRQASPGTRVVILSGFDADRMEPVARAQGAAAYVEKGTPPKVLLDELERIARNGHPHGPGGDGPRTA